MDPRMLKNPTEGSAEAEPGEGTLNNPGPAPEPAADDYKARYYRSAEARWIFFGSLLFLTVGSVGIRILFPGLPWWVHAIYVIAAVLGTASSLQKGELAAREDEKLRLLQEIRDQKP